MLAPEHLSTTAGAWWLSVVETFELAGADVLLLTLAAESWDRCQQAREVLDRDGCVFNDRFGSPRSRPEVAIERDAKASFARLVRELAAGRHWGPELRRHPLVETGDNGDNDNLDDYVSVSEFKTESEDSYGDSNQTAE